MTRQYQHQRQPARSRADIGARRIHRVDRVRIGTRGRATRRVRGAAFALATAAALVVGGLGLSAQAETEAMGKVNVNTASVEELQRLPGVGEARAEALVEARERRGGFQSIDELVEVKGIGPASLEKLRPHVTLQGKTTASAE